MTSGPKVLVISRGAWRDDNSSGNTLTNLFEGWGAESIAQVYCNARAPDNGVCKHYYQITDLMLVRSIFTRTPAGREFHCEKRYSDEVQAPGRSHNDGGGIYDFLRLHRLQVFLCIRELLWCLGLWRNQGLNRFLKDFSPDVIFAPLYDSHYMCSLTRYVARITGRPVATFIAEDLYTYRQFSLSPLYWLNRFLLRVSIRKTLGICKTIYVMAPKQLEEYSRIFGREMKLLSKAGSFAEPPPRRDAPRGPVSIVYTGNVFSGRWRTLAMIGRAIRRINGHEVRAQLRIYTQNPVSARIRSALSIEGSCALMGSVPFERVRDVLQGADIVVHVESFEIRDRLATRLSFSTKLVDYFESGRCILAVGWDEAASIDYLTRNDAAVVVTDPRCVEAKLRELLSDPQLITDYGRKAWECGRRNHRTDDVRDSFWNDLDGLHSD